MVGEWPKSHYFYFKAGDPDTKSTQPGSAAFFTLSPTQSFLPRMTEVWDGNLCLCRTLAGVGEVGLALERMRKELYVLREKGEAQDDGNPSFLYKLGPRAFVE